MGTVHRGFWHAWTILRDNVIEQLQRMTFAATNDVKLTGHDSGGALAEMGALELKLFHNFTPSLENFGTPRVGDISFKEAMDYEVPDLWRITHGKDQVVHVPPQFRGFYHTAHEVYFENDDLNFTTCASHGEDKACSNKCDLDCSNKCIRDGTCNPTADHLVYLTIEITKCTNELEMPILMTT